MKKYIIFAVAALAASVACTKTSIDYDQVPETSISFQVAKYMAQTRADLGTGTSLWSEWTNPTFKTFAFYYPNSGDGNQLFMDNMLISPLASDNSAATTEAGTAKWAPAVERFWPKTGYINFFSYASKNALADGAVTIADVYDDATTPNLTEKKTISFVDNGLGMTAEEVEEYINQIAFSGATDFLEKYKDKADSDQIIGHFGLGFYSAFMVADEVHIDTLSYKDGATAVHWECDGGTEFEMSDGDWDQVGTKITLFLNEDCLEFANEYRAREVIEKYCSFMPTEIYLSKKDAPEEYETIDVADKRDTDKVIEEIHEEAKYEEKENEDGTKEQVEVSPAKDKLKIVKRPVPLNETNPLWTKNPSECTEEDYKAFYRDVFHDYKEPLFWIHLNMDYPFNLKGILYFPKINTEYDSIEGTIKLYNNQVFIEIGRASCRERV